MLRFNFDSVCPTNHILEDWPVWELSDQTERSIKQILYVSALREVGATKAMRVNF